MIRALLDLRRRGFDLAVIEVDPVALAAASRARYGDDAWRMWLLARDATRARFRRAGCRVRAGTARRRDRGRRGARMDEIERLPGEQPCRRGRRRVGGGRGRPAARGGGDARSAAGVLASRRARRRTRAVLTPGVLPVARALRGRVRGGGGDGRRVAMGRRSGRGGAAAALGIGRAEQPCPGEASVEREALRRAARQLGVTAALALAGAAAVTAANVLPARGGVSAGLVGGAAVAAALLLVARLARLGRTAAGCRD